MSAYYSTQYTIEARISALRLSGLLDFKEEGEADSDALEAGFKEARAIIRGYIADYAKRYNCDITLWTDTTCPDLVQAISDKLCLHLFYGSNLRFQEAAAAIRAEAISLLEQIRDGKLDIFEISNTDDAASMESVIATGRTESDFDPYREYNDLTVNPYWIRPDSREVV